jgi:hypothetical protein
MSAKLGRDGRVRLNGIIIGTWHLDENDHYIFEDLSGNARMYLSQSELRSSFIQGPIKPVEISVEMNGKSVEMNAKIQFTRK